MALGSNSYGDTDEIAALVPRHTNSGSFDATTKPTLTQLESEVDQLSATVNSVLSELGFSVPVTQADCVLMLDGFVNKMAAEIVLGINGHGRFGPTATSKRGAKGQYLMILEDVRAFLEANSTGMQRLGATRSKGTLGSLRYRDTDESGDTPEPLFQREQFGEDYDTASDA